MRRREFIGLLGGAATWPLAARAQQGQRVRRVGMLMGFAETDPQSPLRIRAFRETLEKAGWIEGRNLQLDYCWAAGKTELMAACAKQLIGANPDAVVAESTPATAALKQESPTTPVVFMQAGNPVGSGFVATLSRPGGQLTGFTNFEPSMGGKWLEILREIAPRATRVAAVFNPRTHTGQYWSAMEASARSFKIEFTKAPVQHASELAAAIEDLGRNQNGGLVVMPDAFTLAHREVIVELAARVRVPAIYAFRVFPMSGGLISYGIDVVDVYRGAASYVDRILRGEKPSDLPVQGPTKFELVINLRAAKALGLEVSPMLTARADEVIE
jgi:putative tryptophan/tyrosine transport system substrate-binding protein